MKDKVKLGIVGFGRIVELVHVPLLKKIPEIEVAGVYDITPQRLELASKRGFTVFEQLNDLLSSSVDAVLIATPPNSHFFIAAEALRCGKHVFVEKPVTLNTHEALVLQALAEDVNRTITVFHNRRFDGDFLLVKQVMEEGVLGSVLFVNRCIHRFGSGAAFGVKSFHSEWRNEAQYGGGALLDWGIHLIDQLLELRIGECASINSRMHRLPWNQGEVEDYVHASLSLENGIMLSMEINFASNAPIPIWVVGGDKATLHIVSDKEAYLIEKGKIVRHITSDMFPKAGAERIYSSFAGYILRREALEVTLEQAILAMQMLDAIRESARTRKEMSYGSAILGTATGI
ncbi:Gfo/Idh/MocA family protein [Paenibacillus sp. GCM10027628]|uniref:Gfo/Idh/MocA family protein n=1 Tax=Paenibacillus sp. GCM10027628 TaxID=3273413 RepID=UPI0036291EE0